MLKRKKIKKVKEKRYFCWGLFDKEGLLTVTQDLPTCQVYMGMDGRTAFLADITIKACTITYQL